MMIEQRNKSILLDSSGDLRVALAMLVSWFLIVSSLLLIEPSTGCCYNLGKPLRMQLFWLQL